MKQIMPEAVAKVCASVTVIAVSQRGMYMPYTLGMGTSM